MKMNRTRLHKNHTKSTLLTLPYHELEKARYANFSLSRIKIEIMLNK